MSPTLVSEFEAASEAARSTRRDHVGARADLVPFKPKAIVVVPPGEGGVASPREGRGRGERTKAPVLIPDYLALIGDAQDGYLGIAGIGAVTAARLLDRRGPTAACGGWTEPIGDPRLPDRSGRRLP